MLFGEYLVLKGADCLAFPLKFGQTLSIEKSEQFTWKSFAKDTCWFSVTMTTDFEVIETNNDEVAEILRQIFLVIRTERPQLDCIQNFIIEANFDLNWGLGSSSTLISLLSQWSGIDAKKLLAVSFGGSGYDVACATANDAIVYADGIVKAEVHLPEAVTDQLLFVYLGKKQSSREEVKRFKQAHVSPEDIQEMNTIIAHTLAAENIVEFEELLAAAEELTASIIGIQKLKQQQFSDYPYCLKYLGAWGGDFFLATYRDIEKAKAYFREKGYTTIYSYQEIIR